MKDMKIRELTEVYGLDNVLSWVNEDLDDNHPSFLAIKILLLPEARKRIDELKFEGKSLRNITFDEWLEWARKVKKENRE